MKHVQKIKLFYIIGLCFILELCFCGFAKKTQTPEIVIGVIKKGDQGVFQSDLINVFLKYGFAHEKSEIFEGMLFSKAATKNTFLLLSINFLNTKETKKLFLDVTDARTRSACFYEIYNLDNEFKNKSLEHIKSIIQKVEQFKVDTISCDKLVVGIKAKSPSEENFSELSIQLKKKLLRNEHIQFNNLEFLKEILELQDYFQSGIGGYKPNRSITGQFCAVNVFCNLTQNPDGKLKVNLHDTFGRKLSVEKILTSEKDIDKLILEILKFKKTDLEHPPE